MECIRGTPESIAALGGTIVGGPYATEAECLANCAGGSGSGSVGPPIHTSCCENAIDSELVLVITDSGGCAGLAPTYDLVYGDAFTGPTAIGIQAGWHWDGMIGGVRHVLNFYCSDGQGFRFQVAGSEDWDLLLSNDGLTVDCPPFFVAHVHGQTSGGTCGFGDFFGFIMPVP